MLPPLSTPPPRQFALSVYWFGKREQPDSFAVELSQTDLAGRFAWEPFYVAVLRSELESLNPCYLAHNLRGAPDHPPRVLPVVGGYSYEAGKRLWWILRTKIHVNRVQSCFMYCRRLPRALVFGVIGGEQMRVLLIPTGSAVPSHTPFPPDTFTSASGLSASEEWRIFYR
jgi:hypothetical protein